MSLVYETGSASTPEDLISKLQIFAAANGWTVDNYDAAGDECTLHEGSDAYFSFAWDASAIAIYQSLGYTPAAALDAMPDDSGNGDPSPSVVNAERRVDFNVVGPYTAYHFFANNTALEPKYIHIVVEVSPLVFRHFGFGTLVKANDYTGGEYAYGHVWSQSVANIDNPNATAHTIGLDGVGSAAAGDTATLHMEGVGAQVAAEKWGVFSQNTSSSSGTDTAGEKRRTLLGGMRGGLYSQYMRHIRSSNLNSYTPIIPNPVMYRDTLTAPDTWIYMGHQMNVGMVNMNNLNPGDTITLGGETWMVFPWVKKQFLKNDTQESWNAGYAYRKS